MALWRRVLRGLVLLGMLWPLARPAFLAAQSSPILADQASDDAWLEKTLARMTTADKVGQLFVVTFDGHDVTLKSDIAQLIQVYRIGGVTISAQNGNYLNNTGTPQSVLDLTTALQTLAYTDSLPVETPATKPVTSALALTPTVSPAPAITPTVPLTVPPGAIVTQTRLITIPAQRIPLFIAANQDGDGYPFTSLRGGFTDLPSAMAVGATWKDQNAQSVGQIVGHELSAVGVNLLLGPSLDVLTEPRPGLSGDLGTRVFGGDPYWVGRMGRAYVRGLHLGSEGRVAAVGKHLPGLGASDRSLDEEISTVDRSLANLLSVELLPFFAVTQSTPVTDTVDGLMTALIRYRGFQGNIRSVTRPISLDMQGMQQILGQPQIAPWRDQGGVLMTDSLGVLALRRYYSPKLDSFPNRQIASDAFQAGNDLLNLTHFAMTDSWAEQMNNIRDTVLFFRERYDTDENFRARVDQSVRRILTLKHRICPEWTLSGSTGKADQLPAIGRSRSPVAQIAQSAVTLLYPPPDELGLRLSHAPRVDENILIFSDGRQVQECSTCPAFYLLDPNALADTMLRMYGPGSVGQIDSKRIDTFTFEQLRGYMDNTSGSPNLASFIENADWILFGILDDTTDEFGSIVTLKTFLREETAGLETKNVIVFAYGAPYYLDATEVSKLTAYYGVYGKTPPFVEASVQALFQEFVPAGQPPVTVDGVGYNLIDQLRPDPAQTIAVVQADRPAAEKGTPAPLKVGDTLSVRTGVIVDGNGNPVPDGTPVTFHAAYVEVGGLVRDIDSSTIDGIARADVPLEREGVLQITATSDPALNSRPLEARSGPAGIELSTPTPQPTPTHTPTPQPSDTPTPTPTDTPQPTSTPVAAIEPPPPPKPRVMWSDLFLALFGIGLAGAVVVYTVGQAPLGLKVWNPPARAALWSAVCGLVGYLFYGLGLPGTHFLDNVSPGLRGLIIGFGCGLLPLLTFVWLWLRRRYESRASAG